MRTAARDTILPLGGGSDGLSPILVKKGTVIRWSLHSMHRRKDLFGEDAEEFRPERWETLRPPAWAYLPFSGGPRICIGQQFALTQMAYTITRVIQTFKAIEARSKAELRTTMRLTASVGGGCLVGLIPA
jgi:cytochrome P450